MTVIMQSSDLDRPPCFETTDHDQISHYMSEAFRPNQSKLCQPDKPVDFRHRQLAFANTTINAVSYGREAVVEAPPIDDAFLCMFTLSGFADVMQGKHSFVTEAGSFSILNPSQSLKVRLSEDFEQLTLKMNSDSIYSALKEEFEPALNQPLEFVSQSLSLKAGVATFAAMVRSICGEIGRKDSGLMNESVSTHFERALASLLIHAIPHNYLEGLQQSSSKPRPHYVKRALAYMHDQLCHPITMIEVAQAAGVSIRSLQWSFRHYLQITPTMYLRNQRLELARQKIQQSDSHITDIALECGFTHPSKFSGYYKQRFGELPTETRRLVGYKH